MSRTGKITGVLASVLMVATPISVHAQDRAAPTQFASINCADGIFGCVLPVKKPVVKAPVAPAAPAAPAVKKSGFPIIAALLGAAAVIGGIVLVADDDDPASP